MRERKRLESALANDAELERRIADVTAYFDLAKEGENENTDREAGDTIVVLWRD